MSARLKAFVLHLLISLSIAIAVVWLVFTCWYPAPLDKALNVTEIFLLLLLVDVSLGPLLTLVVFKSGKKTLVFDLSVIAVLQLSALCYGVWVVAEGRPAWVVFSVDRFELVQVQGIDPRNLHQADSEYRKPSLRGPRWVATKRPESAQVRQEIMFEAVLYGSDLANRPNFYIPLDRAAEAIASKSLPLTELTRYNPAEKVNTVMSVWPGATGWVPLTAKVRPMVVLLNGGRVMAVVDLRPF